MGCLLKWLEAYAIPFDRAAGGTVLSLLHQLRRFIKVQGLSMQCGSVVGVLGVAFGGKGLS